MLTSIESPAIRVAKTYCNIKVIGDTFPQPCNIVPEEASLLMRRAYALLPHIKITDLLLEVDRWTGLSKHFTHLKTGEPDQSRHLQDGRSLFGHNCP
jgi:hypothetical protein